MPLHLEARDVFAELDGLESVLIVTCPICPPVSLATDNDAPLMKILRSGVKTPEYETFIRFTRDELKQRGLRTGTFTSYLPCTAMCLWTKGQRRRLLRRAKDYDAALVMGCESARLTAQEVLQDTDCKVILGMDLVGITNASLGFRFPDTVTLRGTVCVPGNERPGHLSATG